MIPRMILLALLAVVLLLASPAAAVQADGIIIPPPPCHEFNCPPPPPRPMAQFNIRYHHVDVRIEDGLATTHVDQVFSNPNDSPLEGTYLFPLPADAAVQRFTLWVDGQPVEGKVLTADEARGIYEDTVRQLRDPALLEYAGRGAVQAHIFPIPPGGERRIELEYTQVLAAQNGLIRYSYPLNTEKFSNRPLETVTIKVTARSSDPIRAVYSSSHAIDVNRLDEHNFTASYEASNITPDADFILYYSAGQDQAFHLFSYRDPANPGDPDGYFLLLLAPKPGDAQPVAAKDVLLVLDRSGSMEGEKFQQAQAALGYILKHLNGQDRFFVETFSSDVQSFSTGLSPASDAPKALEWVNQLAPAGSTDINRALLEAATAADRERPTYLIFLTDGLPTEGVTDSQAILANFASNAPKNLRLFPFGVGYDVDTLLLDTLSGEHHGQSTYVQPGQSLDEMLSAFYAGISTPVLTDLKLDFGGAQVYDLYPQPLPDLFAGSQLVLVGRYRTAGPLQVRVDGMVNGEAQAFTFDDQALVEDSRPVRNAPVGLPRLWATRKVGSLLNQIRLQGPNKELIDQVVKLSIRYGIVTPYTSYLVTEPSPLGAEAQNRIAQDAYGSFQAQATAAPSGAGAVQKAAGQGAMAQAAAPAEISADASQSVKVAGTRAFVRSGEIWTDTLFDPQAMKPVTVPFLSASYFQLAAASPDLAAALALGQQVIVVVDGKAYQVVPSDQPAPTLAPLPTQPPAPAETQSPNPQAAPTTPAVISRPAATAQPVNPAQNVNQQVFLWAATIVGVMAVVIALVILSRKKE